MESGVAAKTERDAVSRTQPGRQFHQRKTPEDGGNIVNGCRVATQVVVVVRRGGGVQDGGRGVVEPCTWCQVEKEQQLSVLS